jgi:hypothetical protein
MAQDGCFQSFFVCAMRVTRLSSTGAPLTGVNDGYLAKAPVMVTVTPDRETGVELTAQNGCGALCAYYKQQDQLKKYDINFELCDLDNELIEILTEESLITVVGETVGREFRRVGACQTTQTVGVALEFWSNRWDSCAPPTGAAGASPYWHWFFPRAYLQVGETTMENDFMKVPIEGYLQENPNFDAGVWTENPFPAAAAPLLSMGAVIEDSSIPTAACGYTQPT